MSTRAITAKMDQMVREAREDARRFESELCKCRAALAAAEQERASLDHRVCAHEGMARAALRGEMDTRQVLETIIVSGADACSDAVPCRACTEKRRADAAERELERWRHGQQIEGDFVCPDQLRADVAEKRLEELEEELLSYKTCGSAELQQVEAGAQEKERGAIIRAVHDDIVEQPDYSEDFAAGVRYVLDVIASRRPPAEDDSSQTIAIRARSKRTS